MTAVFPVTVAIGCKGAAAGRTGVLIDSFPLDHGHLQASLKHYVDGTTEVGWVDVEHTVRAKDTPRPVVFRDSALRKQIASALGRGDVQCGQDVRNALRHLRECGYGHASLQEWRYKAVPV